MSRNSMYVVDLQGGLVNVATQVGGRVKEEKNATVFYSRADDIDFLHIG